MDMVIIFCAKYLIFFVVLATALAWWRVDTETKKQFAVAAVIGGIVALVLAKIAGHLYFDPRPFVSHHVKPLISHAADNGFPSDHSLLAGMLTAITFFYSRKIASIMLVMTILIGVARVLAKVHSPIDILAGWLFGAIGAVIGYYVSRWLFTKYLSKKDTARVGA